MSRYGPETRWVWKDAAVFWLITVLLGGPLVGLIVWVSLYG